MEKNTTQKDGDAPNAKNSILTREKCPKCKTSWLYYTVDKRGTVYRNCREAHRWVC